MRRAKMELLFAKFVILLLIIATTTATTTTTTTTSGGATTTTTTTTTTSSGGYYTTTSGYAKSGTSTRMGGAASSSSKTSGAAPPPPKTGGGGTTPPAANLLPLEQEFLNAHNEVRDHAGLPPLKWDHKVAAYAQWYAKSRSKDCALMHSSGPFGENIFWGEGRTWTPKMAVKDWVKEHRFYNKQYHNCQSGHLCGHYTQIVWRDTQKVGCGMVLCGGSDTYIVCSYDPPGNYKGKKPFERHNPAMYYQQERMQRISWIPDN